MAAAEKKKHRISNMLKRGKNDPPDSPPTANTANTITKPANDPKTPPAAADSAYASSDATPSTISKPSAENMVHVESNDDRNLAMNRATGEVVDEDTGEVVTVTTTTTTTTTTTSRGGGKSKKTVVDTSSTPSPSGGGARTPMAEVPGDTNYVTPTAVDAATDERHDSTVGGGGGRSGPHAALENSNSIPTAGGSRVGDAPMPLVHPHQREQEGPPYPIPERNPHRKSREYGPPMPQQSGAAYEHEPVSPVNAQQHNFSYPSRANGNLRGEGQGEPRQQSTFENLKAAAVGLHGVGETLRGTLNAEIDSRYPRHNARKAAVAEEKNRATVSAGQREMAGLRERAGLGTTTTTTKQQQHPAYREDAPPPIPPEKDSAYFPRTSGGEGQGGGASQEVQSSSQTGELDSGGGRVEEKKGGLRRLMKRKPVGAGH